MVLLVHKLYHSIKFPFKLENRHDHEASLEETLQAFRSSISISKLKPGSEFVSLSWIENCFDYFSSLNKVFAKLIVDIDYPVSMWAIPSIEEYLSYSLRLLDLLNSVKYSLSQVSHARVSTSHSLSLIKNSVPSSIKQLRLIEFKNFGINLKLEEETKERKSLGKDWVIHQALMQMKENSHLMFGIVLWSLSGDIKPYIELKKIETSLEDSEGFLDKNMVLKEFTEYNEAKACLEGAMEMADISENVNKLEANLEEMQKHLDDIGRKTDDLFSETLVERNKVLDVFRHRNQ